MSINKFSVFITPEDIYNKITPEQRELFSQVKIINASIYDKSGVHIECLALKDEISEYPPTQKLIGDWYIKAF